MNQPEHFQREEDLAVLRLIGSMTLPETVEQVTTAITFAREQGMGKLLVDASALTGFPPPSLATRYFFIHEWARAAGGMVRIAMVAKREMIDPEKFGVTVAANVGLVGDVFETEAEARTWLQGIG